MKLSNFEKEIITSISNGEVCDFKTFILKHCAGFTDIIDTKTPQGDEVKINIGQGIILKDENEKNKINIFKALLNKLSNEELVHVIETDIYRMPDVFKFDTAPPYYIQDSPLRSSLMKYQYSEIIKSNELDEFIIGGYLTEEEKDRQRGYELAIKSQNDTRKIAYISLSISAILTLVTILFSYFTYTTTREVKITNEKSFPETTKVYIINPQPIDTLKSKPDTTKSK